MLKGALIVALTCWQAGCEQDAPRVRAPASVASTVASAAPSASTVHADGARFYMGRQLAPTMTHEGAPWLVRGEREEEEKTSSMIAELGLSAGDTACDVGAGNGYHALLLAEVVTKTGRVLAVDIQPKMLEMLEARANDSGLTNIQAILGTQTDPKLPRGACDVILMVDVYHELSEPRAMLTQLRRALSPKGRMALVEFREEDPEVPIKPLHKMSKAQIRREMAASGFAEQAAFDGLPWQHLMFFVPHQTAKP